MLLEFSKQTTDLYFKENLIEVFPDRRYYLYFWYQVVKADKTAHDADDIYETFLIGHMVSLYSRTPVIES